MLTKLREAHNKSFYGVIMFLQFWEKMSDSVTSVCNRPFLWGKMIVFLGNCWKYLALALLVSIIAGCVCVKKKKRPSIPASKDSLTFPMTQILLCCCLTELLPWQQQGGKWWDKLCKATPASYTVLFCVTMVGLNTGSGISYTILCFAKEKQTGWAHTSTSGVRMKSTWRSSLCQGVLHRTDSMQCQKVHRENMGCLWLTQRYTFQL